MVLSFFAVKQGALSFVLVAFATILRDLALVSLFSSLSGAIVSQSIGLAGHSGMPWKRSLSALWNSKNRRLKRRTG